ncbi:MAG: aldehyde ferredoxin oxidoreductase, partial [Candidatus Aminicenantes bacterium]|nr:aldehyde ferredoxin oxidoreductase [Candidatus Aminicenantes bacterium]
VLQALTGLKVDVQKLLELGEKISNMTRMYNYRNGRSRSSDTLPERFFSEKQEAGMFKGKYLTKEIFSDWLDKYYHVRGWDAEGFPTPEKLNDLSIKKF